MAEVGVLGGTGKQGRGLVLRLACDGRSVRVGSRDPGRAEAAVQELRARRDEVVDADHGGAIDAGSYAEAAAAEVVVVAVPFDGLEAAVAPLADALAGRLVVSCVNALAFDAAGPRPVLVAEGSAAERVQRLAPAARVAGAFQNVAAGKLLAVPDPVDSDVLVTGDDPQARAQAAALVRCVPGIRPVDVGPLRLSRPVEELTAVQLAVNRARRAITGVRLTGL